MPELPEIETIKMQLAKILPGRKIISVSLRVRKIFQGDEGMIVGKRVTGVRRKAKVLIIDLEKNVSVAFHFKMTGQLVFEENDKSQTLNIKKRIVGGHPTEDFVGKLPSMHTRVIFYLNNGTLYFNDQRMFGWVIVDTTHNIDHLPFIEGLGPELFDIDSDKFAKSVLKFKRPIKLVLMDQTVISGVGNIYANDALWEAGVDPKTVSSQMTVDQLNRLFESVKKVLREGIKYGGATAADAKYINLHGLGGHYQEHFRVYDREGMGCLRKDGGIINKFVLGGRGTYFCPECQK